MSNLTSNTWLRTNKTSGTGNSRLIITTDANMTGKRRTGIITVRQKNGDMAKLVCTQKFKPIASFVDERGEDYTKGIMSIDCLGCSSCGDVVQSSMDDCPVNAFKSLDPYSIQPESMVFDSSICTGCGRCVRKWTEWDACPVGIGMEIIS